VLRVRIHFFSTAWRQWHTLKTYQKLIFWWTGGFITKLTVYISSAISVATSVCILLMATRLHKAQAVLFSSYANRYRTHAADHDEGATAAMMESYVFVKQMLNLSTRHWTVVLVW
jgi:hypothetical protein